MILLPRLGKGNRACWRDLLRVWLCIAGLISLRNCLHLSRPGHKKRKTGVGGGSPRGKPGNLGLPEVSLGSNTKESVARHLLKHLLLYRELLAEHEEILRHKWLESEKVGHDVGFDVAMIDWKLKHRSGWRRARQGRISSLTYHV